MSKFLTRLRRFTSHQAGRLRLAGAAAMLLGASAAQAQQLAFPGAEGAGRFTSGGRGRAAAPTTVFEVTSLADTNTPGTLRYALSQSGTTVPHRTVVFRVCGTIHLTARLNIPRNTTIAGQTAPGDGICLADRQVSVNGDNVIVRFVRFRLGDRYPQQTGIGMVNGNGDEDAFNGTERKNIVVDHCSMSWSMDEAFTFYGAATDSMTLQWNLISEPLNYSYHFETGDTDYEHHGYGGIWGGRRASFHHNLFAHCANRTPRWNGRGTVGSENCDFRNNVIYNWGGNNVYGGEGGNYNLVNNYYKYGPSTTTSARAKTVNPYRQTTAPVLPYAQVYLAGNYVDGSAATTRRNWLGATMQGGSLADTVLSKANAPFNIAPLNTQSATDAYTSVLQSAGCVLPVRDAVDLRIMQEVQARTGSIIDVQGGFPHGTAYSVSQGAWPVLSCGPAPADTDHDGMTDAYEIANGLNPNNAADRQTLAANGYTNLENYLNGLVTLVTGTRGKATGAVLPLRVYPNPATEQLTLAHPRATAAARVTVFNFVGQQVATYAAKAGDLETCFNLGAFARGNYLLVYTDEALQLTAKCVRQ